MILENGVKLYGELYDWLTSISCGEYRKETSYKYYQRELWNPILEKLDELSKMDKSELSQNEEAFLKNVLYEGKVYRKMNYHNKRRGHVFEMLEYASWSSDCEGVQAVPGLGGEILLLVGYTDRGINIKELLIYFCAIKAYNSFGESKSIYKLDRYFDENEIAAPTLFKDIKDIKIINLKDIDEWKTIGVSLEKHKWKRNKI
ncbi:MAG: hypothetical protein RR942_01260 [Romboutsia sp.]